MGKMLEALRLYVFVAGVMAGPVVYAGDPTLVGWWKFDEGVGMTVRDSSSYRHDGALMGDPQWATGQIGRASCRERVYHPV